MNQTFFREKFEWKTYVGKYGDLQKANIDTEEKAWNHAKRHGQRKKENRDIFNGDRELLAYFRNFCKTGEIRSIPDKYKTIDHKTIGHENNNNYFTSFKNKNFLINTHSNLSVAAGDTIMISNIMNILMENNNKITLLTRYTPTNSFTNNLIYENYNIIVKSNNTDIIKEIDNLSSNMDYIFVRNHEFLKIGRAHV